MPHQKLLSDRSSIRHTGIPYRVMSVASLRSVVSPTCILHALAAAVRVQAERAISKENLVPVMVAKRKGKLGLTGYTRSDARKGICDLVVVAYLVECAHFVACGMTLDFHREPVHLIGFAGYYPNDCAERKMRELLTRPNVAGVLLVSLGYESFGRNALAQAVEQSERPVHTLTIQRRGGRRRCITQGRQWVRWAMAQLGSQPRVPMQPGEPIAAAICGGSDGTWGITASTAVGRALHPLTEWGAIGLFEKTGTLVSCEPSMVQRAAPPKPGREIVASVEKATRDYTAYGNGSFATGNAISGLSTKDENSLGACAKSGSSATVGIVKPAQHPTGPGLYLPDIVPDREPGFSFGYPNIADIAEIFELPLCRAPDAVDDRSRLGRRFGDRPSNQGLREARKLRTPQRRHGRECQPDPERGSLARRCRSRDRAASANGRERQRQQMRGVGTPQFILTYKSLAPSGSNCYPYGKA